MTRSEERIPKLRTRGRENRRRLLREAERLLAERNGEAIRFSDVFESAGVSRGSAYRIYIGLDDLMQDLAGEWINNFVEYLGGLRPEPAPQDWQQLSDYVIARASDYWTQTAETLKVLPRIRSNAPESYKEALRALSLCISHIFDRFFAMPEIDNWHGKLSFYVQLVDLSFSDSVRLENRITSARRREAQALGRTYLSIHLHGDIPPR